MSRTEDRRQFDTFGFVIRRQLFPAPEIDAISREFDAANLTNHYRPSIKVAFYLDPVGRDSGCLRVIPGSHRNPYHDSLWSLHLDIPARARKYGHVTAKLLRMWERDTGSPEGGEELLRDPDVNVFGIPPAEVPAHAIDSEPGDVVFFSHQLWHASFGGGRGRRMFTLNFLTS